MSIKLPSKSSAAKPAPRWLSGFSGWSKTGWFKTDWSAPLSIFVGWRLGLIVLSFAALILLPGVDHAGTAPRIALTTGSFYERVFGVWSHWDGEWFLHVAQAGYVPNEATTPFFPLYPILVRIVSIITLGHFLVAGVLVSLVASLLVFVLLYSLVEFEFGSEVGQRTVFYLSAFPTSFYLAATYSEGVFLAATLGAFVAARRYSNWWLTGVCVALAVLARNMGILLFIPLGWEWLLQHREHLWLFQVGKFRLNLRWRKLVTWSTAVFVGLPLLCLAGWLLVNAIAVGDPLNFVSVQSLPTWNRHAALPWEGIIRAFQFVTQPHTGSAFRDDPNLLDLSFWVVMTVLTLLVIYQTARKQLPLSYLLYLLIALGLPLLSPAGKEPLLSYPRFALLAWPVFLALARLGIRWPWLHYLYLFAGIMGLAVLFGRFANWYWVA